jgi:hypothetical protein
MNRNYSGTTLKSESFVYSQNCRQLKFLIVSYNDAYTAKYSYSVVSGSIAETDDNDRLTVFKVGHAFHRPNYVCE